MTTSHSRDWDNGDVLQGIMETRMVPTPSPVELSSDGLTGPSDLALGDPTSLLGLQFVPDSGVISRNPASILTHWLPCQNNNQSPPSPRTRPLDYSQYHAPRISVSGDQDAWNPLQITGVPAAFGMQHMGKSSHMGDPLDGRYSHSHCQYSTPSENGSQYNGLQPSDSGYGSKSCTTRSVITSSYAVDSACSPKLAPREHDRGEPLDLAAVKYGDETMDLMDRMQSPNFMGHDTIKCDYPNCRWTGKCPSDKKKHEARHRKLFKCDEPNCTRKEGFGTINDLARHKKCVHKQEPERGPKVLYMCFGQNCPRKNKKWPRLDNFKQHLARMHNDESAEDLLSKSKNWYEKCVKSQIAAPSLVDRFSQDESEFQSQAMSEPDYMAIKTDYEDESCDSIIPSQTVVQSDPIRSSDSLTLNPIKNPPDDEEEHHHMLNHSLAQPLLAGPPSVELPALKALDLSPTFGQFPSSASMPSQASSARHDRMEEIVSEAAGNMINALTKIMNGNQRRRSQGEDVGDAESSELCDRKREMLQRILSAALDKLSNTSGISQSGVPEVSDPGLDKTGWFQCDRCPKRTRLRCEMKKHKKRHDRPYGCTFHKCHKTFGSKADWKRHENSQHFHLQSWRCTLPEPDQQNEDLPCARLFYRQEIYISHLKKNHQASDAEVRAGLSQNRIGRNGQSQFWCGFCREIIPLRTQGLAAWNERFNHIDTEHFKKGERIGDWLPPSGHLTKRREREQEKLQRSGEMFAGEISDEEEDYDDDAASSGSDLSEDEMALDEINTCQESVESLPFGQSEAYTSSTIPRKRRCASPLPTSDPPRQRNKTEGSGIRKGSRGKISMFGSNDIQDQDQTAGDVVFVPHGTAQPTQYEYMGRVGEDTRPIFAGLHGSLPVLPPYYVQHQ